MCYDCYYKADGGGSENCLYVDEETKYSDCDDKNTPNLDACIVRVYFTSPSVCVCACANYSKHHKNDYSIQFSMYMMYLFTLCSAPFIYISSSIHGE